MTGAFGLVEGWHPREFLPGLLAEENPRADVWEREKGSRPAARWMDLVRLGASVELAYDTPITGHRHGKPVRRAWFLCPKCGRRCRHIYLDHMACRICARLDYSSRHRNRSVPGYNRLLCLRRKIGASPQPFTPVAPRPRTHLRYNRIAAEIGELEARLITHLRTDINDVLARRIKLRGIK